MLNISKDIFLSQCKVVFVKENEVYILKYSGIIYFAKMESSKLNNYSAESWRNCHSTTMVANTKYYSFKPNQTKPRGLGF
jgi:hypothetical protein